MSTSPGTTTTTTKRRPAKKRATVERPTESREKRPDDSELRRRAIERWENEGGRTSASASRDAEQRTTAVSERAAWRREPALLGDGDVAVALRDYTHDLRGARVGLASTLASVRALIAEHLALRVSPDVLAALQRDAVRSCLQTYFGP